MLLSGHAHTVAPGEGQTADLGVIQMRVLAAGEATTSRAFTLAEFTGGQGTWTVPHIHRETQESFFILDGEFTFAVGEQEIPACRGHTSWCARNPARDHRRRRRRAALALMVPGGLEEMFFELADLPPDSITATGGASRDLRQARLRPPA